MTSVLIGGRWAPDECSLPTAQQPTRQREFVALFDDALRSVVWVDDLTIDILLRPAVEMRARELAAAESQCCTFFTFTFERRDVGVLGLRIAVPAGQERVLSALAAMVPLRGES